MLPAIYQPTKTDPKSMYCRGTGRRGESKWKMGSSLIYSGLKQKIHGCFTGVLIGQFIERTGTRKWHVGAVTDISIGICIRCLRFCYLWMNGLYSHIFNGSCDLRFFMVIDLPFSLISEHAKRKPSSCACYCHVLPSFPTKMCDMK